MPTLCSVKLRSARDVCGGAMAPYYNHVAPLCTKRRLSMIPVAKQKPVPTNRVVLLCCRLHAATPLYLENWTNYILEDWTRHAAMWWRLLSDGRCGGGCCLIGCSRGGCGCCRVGRCCSVRRGDGRGWVARRCL